MSHTQGGGRDQGFLFPMMLGDPVEEHTTGGPLAPSRRTGAPHLAKNQRDTRISCTRHQGTSTCAAFIEENRMKLINADKLHRKSGVWGTRRS